MLAEGFRLMAVGMVTVFAFLTLLVGLMHASAAFFEANAHRFPDDEPDAASGNRKNSAGDEEIAVAIVLAMAEATRRGQKV